ncbi:MAG TPA: GDSL-type esterase/lipase family protein, partial [Rhodothermales bacterium]|nr:GDSL-type esterase/lipase family protein [Rhodothermales bacterium]
MRRIKEVCIIGAISLMLLLFVEGGVRLSGIEDDYMQLLAGRSLVMKDSLLGHRNQPGAVVRKQGPEFSATYAIGAQGQRVASTSRQATAATPPDPFRIVLIGDSFTFGIGADYEATWAHVLEQTLQERGWAVEVFNAGVPGYDTRTEALYVDELLPQLQPDLVVLTFL